MNRDDTLGVKAPLKPEGWGEVGLRPRTLAWRWSSNVSPDRTRKRVEDFEASKGNFQFQAWGLDLLPAAVGYELGGLHIALRERYPKVRPDWVDVASERMAVLYGHLKELNQPLAITMGYDGFNELRELAKSGYGLVGIQDAVKNISDAAERRWLRSDLRFVAEHGVSDITATGTIELSPVFRTLHSYAKFNSWRESRQSRRGTFTVESEFTPIAYAYIHEFGHLVETSVWDEGDEAVEHVYGALTEALTGSRPSVRAWGSHLLNYPTQTGEPGPWAGGRKRGGIVKARLAPSVRSDLGRYAATDRSELFAEAFVALWGSPKAELKERLRLFQVALAEVGVARWRLPRG